MKNLLKLTSVLCAIAMVAVLAIGCGGNLGRLAEEGYLTMGTNAEFPPFEFRSNAPTAVDGVDGIDIAIARLIAEELGLQLRVVDMAFDSLIPAVQAGQSDVASAGMTITEERAQSVNFTVAYYTAAQVIVAAEGTTIASAADLEGLTVGVVLGYTGDIAVSRMDDVEVIRSNSGVESILELVNGRVDAVVIDRAPAEAMIAQHPGLITIEDPAVFSSENYGMAIRLDNTELLNEFNTILQRLIADGTIDTISAYYIAGM